MKTKNTTGEKEIFEEAKKKYNRLMFDLCIEHVTIGTRFSEDTENWNLRDMVSECQYTLDCCYEEGNANQEGQYPDIWKYTADDLMSKRRYDYVTRHNEEQKEMHKSWLSKTRRLRNFITKYAPLIKGMKCAQGHCSCYD